MNKFVLIVLFAICVSAQNCTKELCNNHGKCSNDTCDCDNGWITFDSNNGTMCNYEQKSGKTAFLLEFFFSPVGAGYFYIERYDLGIGQLLSCIGMFIVLCIYFIDDRVKKEFWGVIKCGFIIWVITTFIWWLVAIITIGCGAINDGNGAPITGL
jgi:hypothetical protein